VKISQWMKNPKNFLIYLGNPGIGKTFLCAALIPWAMERFINFRYHNERQLFTKVRQSMDEGKGDFLECLKWLLDDEFVMLDDIGSSGFTEWRKDIFFEAIDQRYNSMKPTLITSNLSKEDFIKIYHPRLNSRLFASENTVIELDTLEDFRK
jgi:DNA replication protein DnaC